jgi:hypothetical protein
LAEQLLRNPDGFEVQEFVYDESTHALLSELTALVDSMGQASSRSEAPVLRIAKPMIVLASRLPRYSKNTRRIEPPDAIALRDELLAAKDPHELVVDELPRVLKLWPKTDEERREFISRLDASLHALQSAYPRLLARIEAQVAGAFGVTNASGADLRSALRRRAEAVKGLATDPKLVAVINRMATLEEDTDWREAVGLAVVGSRAPKDWTDADADAFRVSVTHLAREFQILEELAHEQGRTGAQTIVRVGVLGNGQADRAAMVSLDDDGARQVTELMELMRDTLKNHAADGASEYSSVRIAALAKLLVSELSDSEG